jgi:hypothetical protein
MLLRWSQDAAPLKLLARRSLHARMKVIGKLRAIQVFNKRMNPELSRKALADSKFHRFVL